jgi:hypothetical protein
MAGRSQYIIQIMATQTRFDLNAAVENWRDELATQPQLTPDDRRELEKHLADSMVELHGRGLNDEESFWLARRRIGQPQQLAEEFEKADPTRIWRERAFWMVMAVVAIWIWFEVSSSFVDLLLDRLHLYSLYPACEVFICCLPFVLAIFWISTGRMAWLTRKFSTVIYSQARLALVAVLLVIFSSLLAGLAMWLRRMNHFLLFELIALNIIAPLIFITPLVLLMPKKLKASKRA